MSDVEAAERLVITVEPSASETDGLLNAEDALAQVIDFLRLADAAALSLSDEQQFEWKLESASTNSPLTVIAVARPIRPGVDIAALAQSAKRVTARALDDLVTGAPAPAWMSVSNTESALALFRRNVNGIDTTTIDFGDGQATRQITKERATIAIPQLERPSTSVTAEIPARVAYGELEGRMVAVGRYYNRPAFQIVTTLYGAVWCVIPDELVEQLGDEQTISDVWKGKRIIAYGRLAFQKEGRLGRMDVESFREKEIPSIDIADVLDRDFTAGLDPVTYLDRLHGGDLG